MVWNVNGHVLRFIIWKEILNTRGNIQVAECILNNKKYILLPLLSDRILCAMLFPHLKMQNILHRFIIAMPQTYFQDKLPKFPCMESVLEPL